MKGVLPPDLDGGCGRVEAGIGGAGKLRRAINGIGRIGNQPEDRAKLSGNGDGAGQAAQSQPSGEEGAVVTGIGGRRRPVLRAARRAVVGLGDDIEAVADRDPAFGGEHASGGIRVFHGSDRGKAEKGFAPVPSVGGDGAEDALSGAIFAPALVAPRSEEAAAPPGDLGVMTVHPGFGRGVVEGKSPDPARRGYPWAGRRSFGRPGTAHRTGLAGGVGWAPGIPSPQEHSEQAGKRIHLGFLRRRCRCPARK